MKKNLFQELFLPAIAGKKSLNKNKYKKQSL
jgi:hypothetical protein